MIDVWAEVTLLVARSQFAADDATRAALLAEAQILIGAARVSGMERDALAAELARIAGEVRP
jgi:hypothetical protein